MGGWEGVRDVDGHDYNDDDDDFTDEMSMMMMIKPVAALVPPSPKASYIR